MRGELYEKGPIPLRESKDHSRAQETEQVLTALRKT